MRCSPFVFTALLCGCAPVARGPARAIETPVLHHADNACQIRSRTLSQPGRGAVRPNVAAGRGGFAAVWEESDEVHRGIRLQVFDVRGDALGPPTAVADLERSGAEPRVVADGDGYAVLWTVDQADTSVIAFRHVDERGRPTGDVVPAVAAPEARALAVARIDAAKNKGFAVVWWTWAGATPRQELTWLDESGHPRAPSVELSRGPLVDPVVDLRAASDGSLDGAWEELIDGVSHIFVGRITPAGVTRRIDLGRGATPSLGHHGVVFAKLSDATIWYSPLASRRLREVQKGQTPSATPSRAGAVLCWVRSLGGDSATDELHCADEGKGRLTLDNRIASAPRGVLALQVAASGDAYAVVYQLQGDDDMRVGLSMVRCGKLD